ncbi:hypothetical protein EZJ49_13225 [Bdellovibrio bacteriovorus]|uniref:RCC1 domain-containing protein n=1 Tax=Bdellovibrio bacteriovorus TaxID=959 RepID=UPI0021CE3ED4|nr:hypothetical protein [Bdellovibrio bacteriovorus]UXR64025.1 hypothetical protein EZJ49_13225 [Bdellovibrio bacteriovorus]
MFLLGRLISIFLFSISLLGATGCTLDARLSRSETLDGLPSQISYEQKSLYLISGDGQEISYWTNHPPFQADTTTIPVRLSEVQVHSKWCAIIANGDLYCWGSNTNGQLGNGSTAYSEPPVKISSNKKFTQVIAGLVHVCAVDDQKDVYCWGGNSATGGVNSQLTPFKVPLTKPTEATAVSDTDSCALATDKSISCWGARYGVNPIAIVTSEVFISIHGNYDSSFCGLTADGEAFCWGRNTYGQLGTGNTTAQASPTAVQGGHLFAALASYNFGMCGLTFDNDLYCWGQSESGARTTPTLLKSPFGADNLNPNTNGGSSEVCGLTASQQKICVEAFTGESKTEDLQTALIEYNTGCGITDDHMLLCADYLNSSGSGVSYITNPFAYSFITEENFEKIYSSQTENTCAKKKDDNRLYCWGYNYDDIFETGNAQHYRKPVLAAAGKEFKNVSIGDDFVCGIDLNDDAYCSGSRWRSEKAKTQ